MADPVLAREPLIGLAPGTASPSPKADYGWALLALPIVGIIVLWVWAETNNNLRWPIASSGLVTWVVVVGSAVLAAMEARKLGMTYNRAAGTYNPIQWGATIFLLWIIGYPIYLFKRSRFGRRNLLVPGIAIALTFLVSSGVTRGLIKNNSAELQHDSLLRETEPTALVASAPRQEPIQPRQLTEADEPVKEKPDQAPVDPTNGALIGTSRPGFDCIKAHSEAETLICGDAELSALDNQFAALYRRAKKVAPDIGTLTSTSLTAWQWREKNCSDKGCLVAWYAQRQQALNQIISDSTPSL